ncbi:MAG: electron transfer flavoprotein subunit beta/FixA family protein [Planctomycetes bacterium]|nr:electron transfer flavoprotein subunit beta/FixA family protein [Planctomycetota bacterium]MCB9871980.1 electron transfer flavoprotein subunit beta/FixA family protein [Planctomycetota bacterium]MCB9888385.1 electron transfer flavoprotein subunit beta/FixA family protein [Planctomycetota bacterium]
MNIVVCIKRCAATSAAIKVAADGKSIDPTGVEFELNPYDEFAVEQALLTREAAGGGEVTVVTLGSPDSVKELRDCLARGVDKAVLLKHTGDTDAFSTATMLATWLAEQKPDVVFMGKQAVDRDNSQVPQRVATILGYGCISEVKKLEFREGTFTAERDIEGGREVVECRVPAVISTNKGLNEPRYANLKGIMAAKKKPLAELDASPVAPALVVAAMQPPPSRPAGRVLGEGAGAVPALIDALKNEIKIL